MKTMMILLAVAACGTSAKNNELVGQVKKVVEQTPLICPDYVEVDVSLGTVRKGVGSMSREDVVLHVEGADVAALKSAALDGHLVRITYDIQRVHPCTPSHWATSVAVLPDEPAR